jgi:hypothetical protein
MAKEKKEKKVEDYKKVDHSDFGEFVKAKKEAEAKK